MIPPDIFDRIASALVKAKKEATAAGRMLYAPDLAEIMRTKYPELQDGVKFTKKKRPLPINAMTPDQFMDYLRTEPALQGIDLEREIGKCRFHFKAKGLDPSRMRIINWLNRADKTLTNHGRDSAVRAADAAERKLPPPHGWQEVMKGKVRAWEAENPGYDHGAMYHIDRNDFFSCPKSWRDECRRDLA